MAQAVAAQRLDDFLEHSPDAHIMRDMLAHISEAAQTHAQEPPPSAPQDALLVLLPLLIVLSTFLFLLLLFLVCVLLMRRRRGIMLREHDGPVDMSREELVEGEGGFEGVETRWLENVGESVRREYLRAKGKPPGVMFM